MEKEGGKVAGVATDVGVTGLENCLKGHGMVTSCGNRTFISTGWLTVRRPAGEGAPTFKRQQRRWIFLFSTV
jgi:hypothetical protein